MPYIAKTTRLVFDELLYECPEDASPGELNYIVTSILLKQQPKSYSDYNALIGVLECCKLEFYRRAIANYENEKIAQNGDVYPVKETATVEAKSIDPNLVNEAIMVQRSGGRLADWRNGSDGEGQ